MKIGIIGTRGIPNNYGGFEQVTEHLSTGLLAKGHEVFVYSPHHHPYKDKIWNDVHLIHCYDPKNVLKTAGQFFYDLNCIRDSRKRNFDVLLFMGYTSSSIWGHLYPKKTLIISNMDGLEWKRSKYSRPVQKFLLYAERLAVRYSKFHIVDSSEIQDYYKNKYQIDCAYIPYGASLLREEKAEVLHNNSLSPGSYFLLMARMEPENHIAEILDGFHNTSTENKFVVIGNNKNAYGRSLVKKFSARRIIFLGSLFDQDAVHTLRKHARLYFHGHSVGGTNPSLLEAMASKAVIAAHENSFNRAVLGDNAYYFANSHQVSRLIESKENPGESVWVENNFKKISEHFQWKKIVDQYHDFFVSCLAKTQSPAD